MYEKENQNLKENKNKMAILDYQVFYCTILRAKNWSKTAHKCYITNQSNSNSCSAALIHQITIVRQKNQ